MRNPRRISARWLCLPAILSCITVALADLPAPGFYTVGANSVIRYPSAGGNGVHVATFSQPHPGHYAAAFAPDGTFYTIGGTGSSRFTLARVDPVSGAWIRIGDTGISETRGLAIDASGRAIAISTAAPLALYSVDLQTAAPTVIATGVSLSGDPILGLTFTPDGRLWGISLTPFPFNVETLVEIDVTTGGVTPLMPISGVPTALTGLAFNAQGELFGSASNASYGTAQLYHIDLATGAATLAGQPQPQADARALAFPVPEPATSLTALLGLCYMARRRCAAASRWDS
jgi:hypothetical protein